MFEKLNFNMSQVYPMLVVSTMSSGKSTLINALVGKDLLPSSNRACTAKITGILNNDVKPQFEVHVIYKDGKCKVVKQATKSVIADFNQANNVIEMIIEGKIQGIRNSKKALLLVDTPGINNSMDKYHKMVTKKVLDEYQKGLILYIINAQQIGIYDDSNFLTLVAKKLKDSPNLKIIFIINKMDLIDSEKEKPKELIENCKIYIQSKGIDKPILIPISAGSALIFKKALNKEELSELEEENFVRNYKYFKRESYSLNKYDSLLCFEDKKETITVEGIDYTRSEIYEVLNNTGFLFLEKKINEIIVESLEINHKTKVAKY